mmetsp:Transcript_31899/g.96450  ORF Transcript_31899/g.96450 Transcript_31899/m.96450 type:complete len:300 (+) Transcript_31899:2388-3287(+)
MSEVQKTTENIFMKVEKRLWPGRMSDTRTGIARRSNVSRKTSIKFQAMLKAPEGSMTNRCRNVLDNSSVKRLLAIMLVKFALAKTSKLKRPSDPSPVETRACFLSTGGDFSQIFSSSIWFLRTMPSSSMTASSLFLSKELMGCMVPWKLPLLPEVRPSWTASVLGTSKLTRRNTDGRDRLPPGASAGVAFANMSLPVDMRGSKAPIVKWPALPSPPSSPAMPRPPGTTTEARPRLARGSVACVLAGSSSGTCGGSTTSPKFASLPASSSLCSLSVLIADWRSCWCPSPSSSKDCIAIRR